MANQGMVPGFRYTKAQVRALMTQEYARNLQYKGYVLQLDGEGYYTLVHHTQAFGGGAKRPVILDRKKQGDMEGTLLHAEGMGGKATFEEPPPIQKRTPQERLDSMVQKLWPQAKNLGHLPGLRDEDVLPIILNVQGADLHKQRITTESVRAIAAEFLARAEKQHEEKLSHQITRHED